jgi:hypothetical protein
MKAVSYSTAVSAVVPPWKHSAVEHLKNLTIYLILGFVIFVVAGGLL